MRLLTHLVLALCAAFACIGPFVPEAQAANNPLTFQCTAIGWDTVSNTTTYLPGAQVTMSVFYYDAIGDLLGVHVLTSTNADGFGNIVFTDAAPIAHWVTVGTVGTSGTDSWGYTFDYGCDMTPPQLYMEVYENPEFTNAIFKK